MTPARRWSSPIGRGGAGLRCRRRCWTLGSLGGSAPCSRLLDDFERLDRAAWSERRRLTVPLLKKVLGL